MLIVQDWHEELLNFMGAGIQKGATVLCIQAILLAAVTLESCPL